MSTPRCVPICTVLATVIAFLGGGAASASSFADGSDQPRPTPVPAPDGRWSGDGGTYGLIGKLPDGRTFSHTWQQGEPTPAAAAADVEAASAFCSYRTSDLDYLGSGYNAYFYWETWHSCSGSYGSVKHRTQLWRSSWSGWRGYGGISETAWTTRAAWTYYWTIGCDYGTGWYDYKSAVRIYATGIGYWSPWSLSNNTLRKYCGTSP